MTEQAVTPYTPVENWIMDSVLPLLEPDEVTVLFRVYRIIMGDHTTRQSRQKRVSTSLIERGVIISRSTILKIMKRFRQWGLLKKLGNANRSGTPYQFPASEDEIALDKLRDRLKQRNQKNQKRTKQARKQAAEVCPTDQKSKSVPQTAKTPEVCPTDHNNPSVPQTPGDLKVCPTTPAQGLSDRHSKEIESSKERSDSDDRSFSTYSVTTFPKNTIIREEDIQRQRIVDYLGLIFGRNVTKKDQPSIEAAEKEYGLEMFHTVVCNIKEYCSRTGKVINNFAYIESALKRHREENPESEKLDLSHVKRGPCARPFEEIDPDDTEFINSMPAWRKFQYEKWLDGELPFDITPDGKIGPWKTQPPASYWVGKGDS